MILHRYIVSDESRVLPGGGHASAVPLRKLLLWLCHRALPKISGFCLARLSLPGNEAVRIVSLPYAGGDSDLEAFSHNPSDGGFAPLSVQAST